MSRIISLILFFLGFIDQINGQQITYHAVDSMSTQFYLRGQWDSVLHIGGIAKKASIIYPNLLLRMGYAAYMKGNYSLSLKHFNKVLDLNSYNQQALYYVTLNNILLARTELANYSSQKLDINLKKPLAISHKKFAESISIESSIKTTNTELRKTGQYYRIGNGNRINYRWSLQHSFASYSQKMLAAESNGRQVNGTSNVVFRNFLVNDFQYYLKSEFYLNSTLSMVNAVHYSRTHFDSFSYNSLILNTSIKYFKPFADFKVEINIGPLLDSLLAQIAFSSTYYPLGNLRFYGNSRVSFQHRTYLSHINYTQKLGIKINKNIWLEFHGTFGEIKNLVDNEALYIYDALDVGRYRIGTSLLLPIGNKITLLTNYYYEQKKLYLQTTNYNLHSFSIGLSWKL
jgi:hypothetical protein